MSIGKTKQLNNEYGSYICEYGHLHDYSKMKLNEILNDVDERTFNNAEELMEEIKK